VPELNAWFFGRKRVAIMEDNDKTGQAHVIEVANALRGSVPDIRIVTFRELPEHGDLTDWIEHGHGAADLLARVEAAKAHRIRPRPAPIGDWDGKPVPAPEYVVANRIPAEQVFLFSGEGGEGKSIMLQQLCAAHSLGASWLGCEVRQGPAIWIECEDTERALHWRLAAIAEHYGVSFRALADAGLQLYSMVEHDSILAATGKNGVVEPTAAYDWLYQLAGDIKPVLIGIASTSNIFAGNENDRSEIQQFTKLLTRIALLTGGSVALVTHPSMSGVTSTVASHEGLSGSTQWHNAVRGRAVMKSVKAEGESGAAPENRIREIKFHKNQYGPPVASSFVRWQNGLFLPIEGATMDQAERAAKAEAVFIALLKRFTAQKQVVSHAIGRNYAPTRFAEHPGAEGTTRREFAAAMQRLLDAKAIEIRSWGRASRLAYYLTLSRENGGVDPSVDPT
jgi:RecA-family ATPase